MEFMCLSCVYEGEGDEEDEEQREKKMGAQGGSRATEEEKPDLILVALVRKCPSSLFPFFGFKLAQ